MTMLAVAAIWFWIVPRVVEATLRSQLRQAGFDEVHIGSIEVGIGDVVLHDLELGAIGTSAGYVTIRSASAAFTLVDLMNRRIDTLVLDEPTWSMATNPGQASSPFAGMSHQLVGVAAPPELPVRHLAIRGGRIEPPPDHAASLVTVDATLTVAAGQWSLDMQARMGTQAISATARFPEPGEDAAGTVVVRLLGEKPIEFEGSCRLALAAEGTQLALALRRRPGPFEIALPLATWSGDGDVELRADVPFARMDAATRALRIENLRLASTAGVQFEGLATDTHLQGLPMLDFLRAHPVLPARPQQPEPHARLRPLVVEHEQREDRHATGLGADQGAAQLPDVRRTCRRTLPGQPYLQPFGGAVALGNSDVVWAAHNDGEIHRTSNGTAAAPAWTLVDGAGGQLPDRWVSSIAIDPSNHQRVIVSFMGYTPDNLWETLDNGATWHTIDGIGTGTLPALPVSWVVMHPVLHDLLFVATDLGLFHSTNGGASW
ncbi:MAG: hypothetical protein ABIP94_00650, partial [Planctomycetota bacterium]